ncbi:hypothetical protein GX586_14350 [bacterium]|nr:hypothetical protein [bacterium]
MTRRARGHAVIVVETGSTAARMLVSQCTLRTVPLLAALPAASGAAIPPAIPAMGQPEDMTFKADVDGSEQRFVLMLPAGFDTNRACDVLIAFHGHGAAPRAC